MEPALRRQLVSCAPREIYRQGGFYEDPDDLNALCESSSNESGVEVLAELYSPFSYRRPEPVHIHASESFRAELLEHYRRIDPAYVQGAASVLTQLAEVTVSGTTIYLNRRDRRIVYETYRPPDRPDSKLWSGESEAAVYSIPADTVPFFVGSVGSLNYGHWLVDDFPRLAAIEVLRSKFPKRRIEIILPSHRHIVGKKWAARWNGVRAESLRCALRGLSDVSLKFVELDRAYRFERLFYATPVTFHPILKSKAALDFVVSRHLSAQRWYDKLRSTHSRLFAIRRSTRGRVLRNLEAVAARLQKIGFAIVDTESLSVKRQAALFAGAEIVVGVMGAAMTNTLFCRAGARIIHLAPEGWLEPFYWDLAAQRDHRYEAYFGSVGDATGPAHTLPFTLSDEAIESLCASLG